MKKPTITLFHVMVLLSVFISVNAAAGSPLTYQDFASLPDVSAVKLSPEGKSIFSKIHLQHDNVDGTAIEVTDLLTSKKKIVLYTDNSKYDIRWIRWKDDSTLLVGIVYPEKRTVGQSARKHKTRETRLMIVNIENDNISMAFTKGFLKQFYILPVMQDYVIDILPNDKEHILIGLKTNMTMFDVPKLGVFKLNIVNHKVSLIESGRRDISFWQTDQQHRVRVTDHYKKGIHHIEVKNISTGEWQVLWQFENFSEQTIWPMGFGEDPNLLYVKAYHQDRLALFSVNLQDKDLTKKLIFSDENSDINGGLVYAPDNKKVIGVTFTNGSGFTYFDPEYQQLQTRINKALPKTNNRVVSLSKDKQQYLVYANSDIDSGTFYLGSKQPASLNTLAFSYKKLAPELMSKVTKYNYKARDDLAIQGYLTLPANAVNKNLPTIIFPHGGPIYNDSESFNNWSQYFANKGYAVLQMNFRGSSGQGLAFIKSGLKNWGLQMQDDIEDGARQLIADGIANPDKICIVGASYGGYAALMGTVKTPDFYHCAVSIAGVSNVVDLVRDNRQFWRSYNVVDEQVGSDKKHLSNISPVNHANKITVPILLVHGDSDRQVDRKHSEQMYKALTKAKKQVTYITLENEDHYLTNNHNRLKTFAAIDQFLTQHLSVE